MKAPKKPRSYWLTLPGIVLIVLCLLLTLAYLIFLLPHVPY